MGEVLNLRAKAAKMKAAERRRAEMSISRPAAGGKPTGKPVRVEPETPRTFHWLRIQIDRLKAALRERLTFGLQLLLVAAVIYVSISPLVDALLTHARYTLEPAATRLLSQPNASVLKQLQFNAKNQAYSYSGANETSTVKVGGGQYDTSLPVDASKGLSLTDPATKLAFTTAPTFSTLAAKSLNGHLVYPLQDQNGQLVYTVKANGVKEDLILNGSAADRQTFVYRLNLPSGLEARLLPDGSLGVYSADPALFGNISFGSTDDQTKVEAARKTSTKTNLVFEIPAPVIKQTAPAHGHPAAKFSLNNNLLSVTVSGLKTSSFPLTIDPSVIVTSATDFSSGNNEGNINVDTTNQQINRGGLTGGPATTDTSNTGSFDGGSGAFTQTTTAYNGYIYKIAGIILNGQGSSSVSFASLNTSTGDTTWTYSAGAYNLPDNRSRGSAVAYNGYLYYIGGAGTFGSPSSYCAVSPNTECSSVFYTKLNPTTGAPMCPLATACSSSSMVSNSIWQALSAPIGITDESAAVVNNYLVLSAGFVNPNFTPSGAVYVAPLNGDGTLGSWRSGNGAAPTGVGAGYTLPIVGTGNSTRYDHKMVSYNGYLYVIGGGQGSNDPQSATVQYAKVNTDGTITAWTQTSSLNVGRRDFGATVANGYIYAGGGCTNIDSFSDCLNAAHANTSNITNTLEYASINADGSLGAWTNTHSFANLNRSGITLESWNGYLYGIGGCDNFTSGQRDTCTSAHNYATSDRIAINPAGYLDSATTLSSRVAFRAYSSTVVYNGYIYVIGGCSSGGSTASENLLTCGASASGLVEFTQVNPDGSISAPASGTSCGSGGTSAWCQTTAMGARWYGSLIAVNGTMYYIGGCANSAGNCSNQTSYTYSTINANGSLGSWTVGGNSMATARREAGVAYYNGKIYMVGGTNAATENAAGLSSVEYNSVPSGGGALGAWTTSSFSMPKDIFNQGTFANNGYLYAVGGSSATSGYGAISTIYYAKISATGDVVSNGITGCSGGAATWCLNSTTLPNSGAYSSAVAERGYMYINGNSATSAIFQYAPINADGSISTISSFTFAGVDSSTFPSVVASNGYLYETDGCTNFTVPSCGNSTQTVYSFRVNNGGDGGLKSASWGSTGTLNTARYFNGAAMYNGYLYELGGCVSETCGNGGGQTAAVEYAFVQADGTLTWATTGSLPVVLDEEGATAANGYLYAVGGNSNSTQTTTYYAKINANGTLSPPSGCTPTGSWCTASATLSTATQALSAASYNGYVYAFGGCVSPNFCAQNGTYTNAIQSAQVGANGNLSSWTSLTGFTTPRGRSSSVVYNGYLYIVGGCSAETNLFGRCTTFQTDAQYVKLNLTGGFTGSWSTTSSIGVGVIDAGLVASNGFMYLIGGAVSGNVDKLDEYAPINADGSLGNWSPSTVLPISAPYTTNSNAAPSVFLIAGRIYVVGGDDNAASIYASTLYLGQLAIPRVGTYSKLIDTDTDVAPGKLVANGSLGVATSSVASLNYQTATSSSPTFGNSQSPSLTFGTPFVVTADTGGLDRYYWLRFTLDDSQAVTFPDVGSTPTTVTDYTLYFKANPSRRLRGGKTFTGQSAQGLDASP